ncbi:MAG: hypothetical protein A2785_01860 [Candidatus Chisholmbacteria bacterium RIFCSPHIGHO2_01_FULL_49_18]|uniref:Uncharacterized protein n=2 Tax=Candidatus Chisholmiibacteriota TaxID=1817900 RepID=A0A1G1VMW7_9BACT|nr:MAG: hypothetical protein A2785_01860 [Candidatus Chisholmbacteria bacterium RIFCSPHIGHO2_01_FULL_49_18]OGY21341.1 MAG: hypothetical protein A3A65_05245 [Candidatus Chisholmbacteria bacterium RIFCSPLOWO2_01_FULL_49_14]
MDEFRAEVVEVGGKPVEKSNKRGLFRRRSKEPVVQAQPKPDPAEKPAASTQQYKESPWVQRAEEHKLPGVVLDSAEIARGKQVNQELRSAQRQERRRNTAKTKLGLDTSDL